LLIDKRMFASGIVIIAVGFSITFYLTETSPFGSANMTEEEKLDLIIEERENSDYRTLSGILIGVGFLLILISFGARRKRGSAAKKTEKKPNIYNQNVLRTLKNVSRCAGFLFISLTKFTSSSSDELVDFPAARYTSSENAVPTKSFPP